LIVYSKTPAEAMLFVQGFVQPQSLANAQGDQEFLP